MVSVFGGAVGQEGVDALFAIISAFIIFTMQSGFGLLESGMVSVRSEANVMVKNMIDVALGGAAYWFVGYGFSFGPNARDSKTMSGEGDFITDVDDDRAIVYIRYFFQLSFATTATTIVSGAVAERVKLGSYMIFAIINTSLVYVFPCHWLWSPDGWLYGKAIDFAGSSVVHMSGGAAALAGTLLLKPRSGRYTKSKQYFAMASPTNVVLGTFFLWWGWIGFNCGSQLAISGDNWKTVARVAVVTMNGACGGGLGAVLLDLLLKGLKVRRYILSIPDFTCGILAGLVSITAGASVIRPWEALLLGFIGSLIALGFVRLLDFLHIDDPVGCFGVHWAAGFWAMMATGFFADTDKADTSGVFRKGNGLLLAYNLLACITVSVWSFGLTAIVFFVLKKTIGIRLEPDEELKGSDEVEHNVKALEGSHILGKKMPRPEPMQEELQKELKQTLKVQPEAEGVDNMYVVTDDV